MAAIPTLERLNELFRLEPETGLLWRRISVSSRARAGEQAGYLNKKNGYRFVWVDGKPYRQHVLIWFMLFGEWCPRLIDHENRDRGDNRPFNLRKATESQQRQNSGLRSDNTSGERGVRFHRSGKYVARLYVGGVETHLGYFATLNQAAKVARAARLTHYGEYAPAYDQTR